MKVPYSMGNKLPRANIYPNVSIVKDRIRDLKSIDLSKITFDELEKKVKTYFCAIPYSYCSIDVGKKIFRARLNYNRKKHFKYSSDLSAPPDIMVSQYGRANKPKESILYTAANLQLALYEICNYKLINTGNPFIDEVITISIWEVTQRLTLANIIHHKKLIESRSYTSLCNQYIDTVLNQNLTQDDIVSDKEICNFFCGEFIKENIITSTDYMFSALYSNHIKDSGFYDGINYPSVACKYAGDNQAIFLRSAKSKLKCVGCIEILCRVFKENAEKIDFVMLGENMIGLSERILWNDYNYRKRNIHDLELFVRDNNLNKMSTHEFKSVNSYFPLGQISVFISNKSIIYRFNHIVLCIFKLLVRKLFDSCHHLVRRMQTAVAVKH